MHSPPTSRRHFLRQINCAAIGSSSILSTLLNLKLANNAAANSLPTGSDSKALVCIFLSGGIDSYQMLIPWQQARYHSYATTRGSLAIPRENLLRLNGTASDFALHPSMTGLHRMATGSGSFTGKKRLAAIANVGTLIEPITKLQYQNWENGSNTSLPVPRALFSHSDQIEQWQTAIPQGRAELTGWAGRAADIIHSAYNTQSTSMSISLSGNNILQVGKSTAQFAITPTGTLAFENYSPPHQLKNTALRNTLDQNYSNLLTQSFADITRQSDHAQLLFQSQFDSPTGNLGEIAELFPSANPLASSLRAVLRSIKIRSALGLRRQTFFINSGGWDMHGDLTNPLANQLSEVDAALTAFQSSLEALGLANDVLTFTASDFGRTLRSNGRGTDHAWGGNAFVMGGPVDGGKIFGTFPDLSINGPDDIGYGGRLMPSTSADLYFAEMLRWFGVPPSDMASVLPNIHNFWPPHSTTPPLGFIHPS